MERATKLLELYKQGENKTVLSHDADVSELKPTGEEQNSITSVEICHLTSSYLDKAYEMIGCWNNLVSLLESVRYFGQISAGSVELVRLRNVLLTWKLLRIVESYLIDLDTTDGIEAETAQNKSTYVMMTASSLVEKLSALSNAYINLVKTLKQESSETFTEFGKKGETELEESKRCADDIETKVPHKTIHSYWIDKPSRKSNSSHKLWCLV